MVTDTKKELRFIIFALLIIALYLSPLFILQENAHIRVHDNLDSNIAWYKVLARSGQMFGDVKRSSPKLLMGYQEIHLELNIVLSFGSMRCFQP